MLEAMRKAKRIFEELGIIYWLDCGTLLWAYRDSKPDPVDCDFCIWEEDRNKLWSNIHLFMKKGFRLYDVYKNPSKGIVEVSMMYNGYKVDIFIKFIKDNWAYHIATSGYDDFIVGKAHRGYFIDLKELKMGKTTWPIPDGVEDYLTDYYGDWKTHRSEWDWRTDAKCIDVEFKI